jgi:serine/threonine protein kinase
MVDHNELLPPGMELGGFRIESQIGHGNMGIIYRAIQVNLNRPVALKVLFKTVAADQDFVRSFFREAQAAAAFTHQNIVQAFDVGQSKEGIYYFAMELIEGGDIDDFLKKNGPYDAIDAIRLIVGIVDGLDYGSSLRKLTHGDIKPANIMLTQSNSPKLADLGLARMGGEIQGESDGIMLTPLYAAPEMIQGQWEMGDPRADMYSIGATLYHMISGTPPFTDDDYRNVIHMQVNSDHTPLHDLNPKVPIEISKVVDKFLEKDPNNRFPSWEDAKSSMEAALKSPHGSANKKKKKVLHYHKEEAHQVKKKRNTFLPIAIIAILGLIIGGYFMLSMKKNVSFNDYANLQKSFSSQSTKETLIKINDFIDRYKESTPSVAFEDLKKFQSLLKPDGIFSSSSLLKQIAQLKVYESEINKPNKSVIHQFIQEQAKIANKLNKGLDNNGLTLHFPFDNSLQNFADFHTFENINSKGSPKFVTARVGKGIEFDGGSINYGDTAKARFSHSGTFTISLWLKPAKLTAPILGKCEVTNGELKKGYLLSLNNAKVQLSLYGNSSTNMLDVVTKKEVTEGEWVHILIQYSDKQASIYLNGKKEEIETSSTLTKNFASNGPLVIGFKYFKGVIDDVRIWSRVLTNGEIAEVVSYRSESKLEQAAGQYHTLIKLAHLKKNEAPITPKEDTPPQNSGLKQAIALLSDNYINWEEYSEKALATLENLDDPQKFHKILRHSLKSSKKDLIDLLSDNEMTPQLKGQSISHDNYRNYKFSTANKEYFCFKKATLYGTIEKRFYWDENKSTPALIAYYETALKHDAIDLFPSTAIAILILSKGSSLESISQKRNFPVLREFYNELLKGAE